MKTLLYTLMVFMALGGTAVVMTACSPNASQQATVQYHCPMHPTVISDHPGSCKICGMDLVPIEKEETFDEEENVGLPTKKEPAGSPTKHEPVQYVCPMHPEEVSDHPGSCSICGMDLKRQALTPDHTGSHSKTENMDPHAQPEAAKVGDPTDMKQVPGYSKIRVSPEQQQLIGVRLARAELRILEKKIRVVGEVAHDPEMYQAQAEYLKSRGTGLRASARLKLEHMGMSSKQIKQLDRRGRAKRNLIVRDKDKTYWIYAYFYEADLPLVQVGQEVSVTVPTFGDRNLPGRLQALRAHIDTRTRSIRGIIEVYDPHQRLQPGLFVNVEVNVSLPQGLVIPTAAVMDTGKRQIAFVKKEKGTFIPREVKLGATANGSVLVTAGIQADEEVVVGANFMLDSESRLKAAIKSSGAGGGHQH